MRLNQNPLTEVPFNNFGGGYAGAKGTSTLKTNESQDLDQLVILPSGGGIRNMNGDTYVTYGTGTNQPHEVIQGLNTFKDASNEYLVFVTVGYTSTDVDVWDQVIGSSTYANRYTYTSTTGSQNDIFSIFKFKTLAIGVCKGFAPFKVTPGTSGAVLGGSPPSGGVGISWNNRAWIGNTSSTPSKLQYSILDDPEDWSSSGSGFVNPQQGDGDELTALMPISNNVLLYFKRNSVFQVVGRSDPFAVFPLFTNVGCVGKHAVVEADGLVYFITPQGDMKITDGQKIYDDREIPSLSNADDLWAQIPTARRQHIQGIRQKGDDYDHIVWYVSFGSSQSTNNYAIRWDLKNQCWLKQTAGAKFNVVGKTADGIVYGGDYSGRRFKLDVPSTYTFDSEVAASFDGSNRQVTPTNPVPVKWFWRTDNLSINSLQNIVQVERVNILTEYRSSGSLKVSYGYDGFNDMKSIIKSIVPSTFVLGTSILGVDKLGGFRYLTETVRPLGRGQTFNLKLSSNDAVQAKITKFVLVGRQAATKVKEVR